MHPYSLNIKGSLVEYDRPAVMGVINCTPDSFHAPSRVADERKIADYASKMISSGVDIIDIGACSTRPGSTPVSVSEEAERLRPALSAINALNPDVLISVDTSSAEIAKMAVEEYGVAMINDVSGCADERMVETVSRLRVPYVLTHNTFSVTGSADDAAARCLRDMAVMVDRLRMAGIADIIADPGFGFGKTVAENYDILSSLDAFRSLGCPILVGVSRKSMITKPLGISADNALAATSMLNMLALDRGAAIIRVHDVVEGVQAVNLHALACKKKQTQICYHA